MILLEITHKFKQIIKFIKNLNFQIQFPIIIYYNNKSAITITKIKKTKYH